MPDTVSQTESLKDVLRCLQALDIIVRDELAKREGKQSPLDEAIRTFCQDNGIGLQPGQECDLKALTAQFCYKALRVYFVFSGTSIPSAHLNPVVSREPPFLAVFFGLGLWAMI